MAQSEQKQSRQGKPNFLVFMSDQQNGLTAPPYNRALMPNLQRLAENGVSFSRAYCPSPHCCPSRASFFSGLYPSEHGVWNNVDVSNALSRGLFDGVRLFSEDLRAEGYQLYFSGKWHVSAEEGPDQRGFELVHHLQHQNQAYSKKPYRPDTREWSTYQQGHPMSDPGRPRRPAEIHRAYYPEFFQYGTTDNPFHDGDVVSQACRKLSQVSADQPFFCFVGTLGPHDPYRVPQEYLDLYDPQDIELPPSFHDRMTDKPALYRRTQARFAQLTPDEHRESIRHYLAFCSYEDALFGQLLDQLEERDLLDNTIVIYVSDHGDYMGAHQLWAKGLPAFREAYHVCSVIGYGPLKAKNQVVDAYVSLTDYAPTFLELAGIDPGRSFSGRSLAGFLNDRPPEDWRREVYTQTNGNELYGIQRMVFNQSEKFVFNGFDFDEYYDLEKDPHEMHNLIGRPGIDERVHELSRKLWQFAYDHQDNAVNAYIMTALADYGPGIIFS